MKFPTFIILYFSVTCFLPQTTPIVQQINYRGIDFDIVKIDLRKSNLQFFWKNNEGISYQNFNNLKTHFEAKDQVLHFAMNGGMYLKDGTPQGLYIENGATLSPIDLKDEAYGNFYLQPNGVFYLKGEKGRVCTTLSYAKENANPDFATQSGPMLVIENELHPVFVEGSSNLHIRNGVGQQSEHEFIFAISNQKVNLYDFAMLFKERLGCANALYLDGFVSKAYIPKINRLDKDGKFGCIIGVLGE